MKLICNRAKKCISSQCIHCLPHKQFGINGTDCEKEVNCCVTNWDVKCVPYVKKKKKIPGVTMMICKEGKYCGNTGCLHSIPHPYCVPTDGNNSCKRSFCGTKSNFIKCVRVK